MPQEMTLYHAEVWRKGTDQYGIPCWYNNDGQKATYDPPHPSAIFREAHSHHPPQQTCNTGRLPLRRDLTSCNCSSSHQPRQHAGGAIVVVRDRCEEDKWSVHTDDATGKKFFHNPAKKESTWTKPKDFDEKNNGKGAKPPPPTTKPPTEKKRPKYHTDRKTWLMP